MLHRCAARLAADVLERTARLASEASTAENLLTGSAPEIWQAWQRQHEARLLDRGKLLEELLAGQSGVEVGKSPPPPPTRKTVLQRLTAVVFGDRDAQDLANGGLAVRMNLPDALWRKSDMRGWPAEMRNLDAQGAERFEATLRALNLSQKPEAIAAYIVTELARCVGACVRDARAGGTVAARQLLQQDAEDKVRNADAARFGTPRPKPGLGLSESAELPQAWERFERECR